MLKQRIQRLSEKLIVRPNNGPQVTVYLPCKDGIDNEPPQEPYEQITNGVRVVFYRRGECPC